ncbi:5-(carboxyamino)imidazole ribonucleotide synthase [Neorickettsia findlayensis]|uniref:N5-carboxyaminoimidazole ribonucleotide synthase n=1 Tax=Neorickettsia findlayensis TaxID=2686014 RepID=A0A6P1GAL3_9RICK|nr:5-(carboxyamino)imidazole ribonucleotide synthase [Neorickettsia findlayensis]QHD65537.1 5-(carboxyamino)imidazole ribonucleotide synthase [Neorickettsia findlayensis]
MQRIGIVGGGQLGKMIAIAAYNLGFKVCVLAEEENSPAIDVARDYVVAPFLDKSAILHFAEHVDSITFETENIPLDTLDLLHDKFNVPNTKAIKVAQNRFLEKEFLKKNGIPTTEYWHIQKKEDLNSLDFPVLLKTIEGGYDGKGQFLLESHDHLKREVENLEFPLIGEKLFRISKEFSIIISRNETGNVCFPIAENVHVNGILRTSSVPAVLPHHVALEVENIGFQIADLLEIKGLLCVEFFLDEDNKLVVNEIAPRPHNSGHWSMDCCDIDQFEELVLSITGNKLKKPNLIVPCTMKNILGDEINTWKDLFLQKNVKLYNYGKKQPKTLRKMGHVNILHP